MSDPATNSTELVRSASRGDHVAVEALLARHLPGLRAFVRLRAGAAIRARESCSDLTQSVCREVLGDLSAFEYRDERSFKQWLYTTALRKIIDRARYWAADRRDPGRERPAADETSLGECYRALGSPSAEVMSREAVARIESAFDGLPEDYKEVITLARLVGLTHEEIARRMQRTQGAVTSLLYRALARLSWLLEERHGER